MGGARGGSPPPETQKKRRGEKKEEKEEEKGKEDKGKRARKRKKKRDFNFFCLFRILVYMGGSICGGTIISCTPWEHDEGLIFFVHFPFFVSRADPVGAQGAIIFPLPSQEGSMRNLWQYFPGMSFKSPIIFIIYANILI